MNGIRPTHIASSTLSALLILAACSQDPPAPPRVKPAAAAVQAAPPAAAATAVSTKTLPGGAEANTIFKTRCIICHGESGQGNGAGAAALTVKPRNYTDGKWQKSVTDEDIGNIVVKGGGAVGKDPGMPANPDLKTKPEVVADLVKIVRSFAPKDDPSVAAEAASAAPPVAAKQATAKGK